MWTNRLKARIGAGETIYGCFLRLPGTIGVELAVAAGFDFVIIDLEHSAIDLATADTMIGVAAGAGVTPLVRVPDSQPSLIRRVLDSGAHGVMVPMVASEAEAAAVGQASKFPPLGARGLGGALRGTGWKRADLGRINQEVLTIVQIETQGALSDLEAIARQPGVDMLFVGPTDLSIALGFPGQVDHPAVIEAALRVNSTAQRAGKLSGIYAGSPETAAYWRVHGVKMIAASADTTMLAQAMEETAAWARG